MSFGATNLDEIFTWVDESYGVHHDMKIQTRGDVSMVLGVSHCSSGKNCTTTSSTESELVGESDYVPYNI